MKNIPLNLITLHPLVADLPRWADESPDMQALKQDIADRGVDQPVIVIADGDRFLLVDGRHRFRASELAALPSIPCMVRDAEEAADIILHSLINRRHLTKGAQAYLSYPVIKALVFPNGGDRKAQSTESTVVKSADDLCAELGFSRDLFFQAKQIHEAFAKSPELREKFEPSILEEGAGLGGVLAGIGAHGTSLEGDALRKKREKHDQLFLLGFQKINHHLDPKFWGRLSLNARTQVASKTAELVQKWPDELVEAIAPVIKAKLAKGGK